MNSPDDVVHPSMIDFDGAFDEQVESLMYHVRLTAFEVQKLRHLFSDLEQALQSLAPGLIVKPFGSIVTGLGIRSSDVDCFIELPSDYQGEASSANNVIYARNLLRKRYALFTNVFAITTAKVPIVKFLHTRTNRHCDVNFKSPAGVFNSQLIGHLLHMDPLNRALKLTILIKYWSKVHKFTGTNLLASYALTLMVIFYLQLMNILPPIIEMQKYVPPVIIDHWNMAFDSHMTANSNNNDSLFHLLGGFFKCYDSFNFDEYIISPYLGRLLSKKEYKKLQDVPEQFHLYRVNVSCARYNPLKIDSAICIQDPFEHARNCSVAVSPKLAAKIKSHIRFAAKTFDERRPECFLKAIFTEDPTRPIVNEKPKQNVKKLNFLNKVIKNKQIALQKQHIRNQQRNSQGKLSLIKCYEQINMLKRAKTNTIKEKHRAQR